MIQLYINDKLVDITESVGVFLNKKFENVQNPTKYFCDYSKTITLPMTPNNKVIFDNYNRQDSLVTDNTIDPRKKIPFKLFYNSKLVMEGYCKINNANTIYTDNKFEIELYSQFGLIMHEIEELTFNKYECQIGGGDKDNKYYIPSPWGNEIEVDRNLIKASFQKNSHNTAGTDILDYVQFIPTYQGKYDDFESDKEESFLTGDKHIQDMSRERDEHYVREFRSYYQQPSIFMDKLWLLTKEKIEEITGYQFILDGSWFNNSNPYWRNLIYTCPSLYQKDDNFFEQSTTFNSDWNQYSLHITSQSNLSSHHSMKIYFGPNGVLYNNGTFNQDKLGYTEVIGNFNVLLFCPWNAQVRKRYFKIREDNPLFVKYYAVNAETNQVIANTTKTVLIYSKVFDDDISSSSYDEVIDVGISDHNTSPDHYPTGYSGKNGAWFQARINLNMKVRENVSYYIAFDCYFSNNSKGVEYSGTTWPLWDWVWTDYFPNYSYSQEYGGACIGYYIFNQCENCTVKTIDYVRSTSILDMYRIFPKDTRLVDVLLNYSKMFGLMWDVDQDEKKITVMNRNKFFKNYTILDWTNKIDRNHDFVLEPLCFDKKYINFNVEEGKGDKYEQYASKFGGGYGTKVINTEYQFNTESEDLFEKIQPSMVCSKRQFSRMFNTEYPDNDVVPFMGWNFKVQPTEHYVENDDEGKNAGNYGAFYFFNGNMNLDSNLGLVSQYGYTCVLVTDDTPYQMNHDEFMWNMTGTYTVYATKLPDISTISKGSNYSIHFECPKEYYLETPQNVKYVYNLFWKNFIDERYSVQNKKLTCYVYITPEEYKDIKFREFVKIDNTLYHINSITDYDFDTNSPTKVELVQVWNIDAYTDGQSAFSALSVSPDTIEINNQEYLPVEVYSSNNNWEVYSKPTWVNYTIDSNTSKLYLKANSDPLRSRTGTLVVRTPAPYQGYYISDSITITQRPLNTYLNLNPTSATVDSNGGTIEVSIDSRPNSVTVVSKPSWCTVQIRTRYVIEPFVEYEREVRRIDDVVRLEGPVNSRYSPIGEEAVMNVEPVTRMSRRTDLGNAIRINTLARKVAVITVNPNNGWRQRSGTVRFSNGNVYKNFTIRQIAGAVVPIHFNDEIMEIERDDFGTFDVRTNVQVDVSTIKMTKDTSKTQFDVPVNDVDRVQFNFYPQFDSEDHGDNNPETVSSGGQISMITLDGKRITQNYNYGYVLHNYNVTVRGVEGGSTLVDNVLYTTTFFQCMPDGTTITVEAVPDEGCYFERWSDGNTSISRTLTVSGEDIDIWPIFDKDNYMFDTGDVTDFDTGDHIKYR